MENLWISISYYYRVWRRTTKDCACVTVVIYAYSIVCDNPRKITKTDHRLFGCREDGIVRLHRRSMRLLSIQTTVFACLTSLVSLGPCHKGRWIVRCFWCNGAFCNYVVLDVTNRHWFTRCPVLTLTFPFYSVLASSWILMLFSSVQNVSELISPPASNMSQGMGL